MKQPSASQGASQLNEANSGNIQYWPRADSLAEPLQPNHRVRANGISSRKCNMNAQVKWPTITVDGRLKGRQNVQMIAAAA